MATLGSSGIGSDDDRMKSSLYGTLSMLQECVKYCLHISSCHPSYNSHDLVMASIGEGETEEGVG